MKLICFALIGAIGAFAQAPFDVSILILGMMALGFIVRSNAATALRSALTGWAIGFGYFGVTLSWIISPFQVDPSTVWMAPFGLFFMAAGMALFWALAFWMATVLRRHWALIVTWTLAEMLRAYVFTGFPWGSPPQSLLDSLAGQALAYVGPHGVMLGLCAAAWALAQTWVNGRSGLVDGTVLAVSAIAIYAPAALVGPVQDLADRPTIRLVQPNAPQAEKWSGDKAWTFVDRSLGYTRAAGHVDLILWPETSVPTLLHNADNVMQAAGEAGGDATVALGILRARDDAMLVNSMVVLDGAGTVTQTYDKHHLVPFGEYIPLRAAFNAVGLNFVGDMFGDGFGRGEGAKLLDFGKLGAALPLICYEAVFAHDVGAAPARPNFLIQITNDAWFGDFAGPQQHLAQARMRAIEQGLPLARAANTGISAMIGPRGQIIASVPLNEAGFVDAPLPEPLHATLYSKSGDKPLGALLILVVLMLLFSRLQRTHKIKD
ncbi:MAG: apolipoprotein N-acyltransferase [Ascidiaceihabitans sp.]|nr:apolipoprotein N-acyltransferase [Ascidiaceihabitans sp.]